MRPPVCEVCGSRFSPTTEGGTVKFANYVPPDPEGIAGHPKGLEWFCSSHIDAARKLADLTSNEAIRQLKLNS